MLVKLASNLRLRESEDGLQNARTDAAINFNLIHQSTSFVSDKKKPCCWGFSRHDLNMQNHFPTMDAEEPTAADELHEQELELWCLIVGMVGTAFPVIVKSTDRVWELQKTIKNEAVEIYGDFNAAQLRIFLARKENGEWLTATEVKGIENGDTDPAKSLLDRGHLASMSRLAGIFKERDANVVHVLVPAPPTMSEIQVEADIAGKRKRSEQSIGDVETMGVSPEELNLLFDALGQKKQTEQEAIGTSGLNEFWKGYGGFPPSYFVRKEELMLWGLVMRIMSKRDKRFVIVGSAGVGKSCFLILVGFYLAFVEKRKVLIVRRLKDFSEASAVVFLDGDNCRCIRKTNLSAAKISSLPDRKEFQGALILVDGYSRREVDHQFGLFPFQLLATSVDDKMNFDDSTCEVILPGWRYDDLLQYAKLTLDDWKKSTGLGQEKHKDTLALVKEQYFYSGGSLRDFCRYREDIKNGMDGICGIVRKLQTVDLEDVDPQRRESFDRVRRDYVIDPTDEEHYWLICHWRAQMDSGYAFKQIGRFMDCVKHFDHYQFAQKTRAGFWGSAYEQCFHGSVRRATKRSPVQVVNVVVNSDPSYSNQRYDRIEIRGRAIECEGAVEEECYECLAKLSARTYWHPDGVDFPLVDAVVMCEAVLRGSNEKETIVAVISTTVRDTKTFKSEMWKRLNRALDDNDNIPRTIPRAFVVVGPDASTCKRFSLIDAPAPDDFMVCCYDPLKFFRKPPNARIA